eukprot:GILK01009476.1.p1 GENE.GILK01009476.1~~GILK01009476.1.p1  ORF type:complete len:662 (+),score=66.69 GILK01009476.1:50-2035(+)
MSQHLLEEEHQSPDIHNIASSDKTFASCNTNQGMENKTFERLRDSNLPENFWLSTHPVPQCRYWSDIFHLQIDVGVLLHDKTPHLDVDSRYQIENDKTVRLVNQKVICPGGSHRTYELVADKQNPRTFNQFVLQTNDVLLMSMKEHFLILLRAYLGSLKYGINVLLHCDDGIATLAAFVFTRVLMGNAEVGNLEEMAIYDTLQLHKTPAIEQFAKECADTLSLETSFDRIDAQLPPNASLDHADILTKYKEFVAGLKRPNILIIGGTGVGKSSLINKIFGNELSQKAKTSSAEPCTEQIEKYEVPDVPVILWDTKGFERNSTAEMEAVLKFISKRNQEGSDLEFRIHIVWFLINAASHRIEQADLDLAAKLEGLGIHFMFLLTKCDLVTKEQVDSMRHRASFLDNTSLCGGIFVVSIVDASFGTEAPKCDEDPSHDVVFIRKTNSWCCYQCERRPLMKTCYESQLVDVVEKTFELLPEITKLGFSVAQRISSRQKLHKSIAIVVSCSAAAATVGVAPLPFSDWPLLVATQGSMFAALAVLWGVPKTRLMNVIGTNLLVQGVISCLGLSFVSLLKLIPGLGHLAVACINGSIATSLTAAYGILITLVFRQLDTIYPFLEQVPVEDLGRVMMVYFNAKKVREVLLDLRSLRVDEVVNRHATIL